MKFTPKDQAAIAKYALWHGNKAAIRHFSFDHQTRVDLDMSNGWWVWLKTLCASRLHAHAEEFFENLNCEILF